MKPETRIVHQIESFILANGGEVLKIHGSVMQRSGEPDLIGSYMLTPFVYEVKLPNETPRDDQLYRLERWRKQGFAAGWGTSLQDFKSFMSDYVDSLPMTGL